MTFEINNTEASFTQLENGKLEITVGGKKLRQFSTEELTSLITIALAARKSGYEFKRQAKAAEKAARKAETAAKKVASKEERIAALQAQLAELQTA